MSADLNSVTLVGRLTRDAEQRVWGEQTIQSLRLAVTSRGKKGDQWEDRSNYFDVTLFGREGLSQYLTKGTRIGVAGRLQWREWQAQDGSKRQAVEVVANDVQLLDGRREDGERMEGARRVDAPGDSDIPF